MTEPEERYQSLYVSRYCSRGPLVKLFSERNKTVLWRQLWIWLAESELELGLKQISQEGIDEMKANRDNIEWQVVRDEERRLKHDVMAHNHAFGKICPKAAGFIHLGATSCFVQDNADLIVQRDAIDYLLKKLATVLSRLAAFSEANKDVVTVGRTHYQTASLVTVGKRAVLWAQELLIAFKQLEHVRENLRFRGIKGATGTQDSFMTLFGDEEKVEKLDELVTAKAGFAKRFYITGQTYSRQQDSHLIFALSCIGAAAEKICKDLRLLQVFGEMMEPFEQDQIGSSAMPYKRNPMKSERCCSFARGLIHSVEESLQTLADQGFERTLDDSAGRRMLIPDSLMATEALLMTLQNIVEGLRVQHRNIERIVSKELPFLALEKAMMWLTECGCDRQIAHEKIRQTALAAKDRQEEEGHLFDPKKMLDDPFYDQVRDRYIALLGNPHAFIGRCTSQVGRFIAEELDPAIGKYLDKNDQKVQLDV